MARTEKYNLNQKEQLVAIGKALSSELRLMILEELEEQSYNVNEIAELLQIPASSAAMHVRVLEEAGLIETELRAAVRGSMKVCKKNVTKVVLDFRQREEENAERIHMPIGNYVDYHVEPTCGMVSREGYIDMEDEAAVFYNPARIQAKLIWFGNGYLEYRFPNAALKKNELKSLEVSVELCSEDHEYNMDCPSDITLWINDLEVGTWTSPSDFGGRRGKLNPAWWPSQNTQYGMLKTWSVKMDGSYLDGKKTSLNRLAMYHLAERDYISVKIGIKEEAENKGGVNIFGDGFGDYPQDIVLKLVYLESK